MSALSFQQDYSFRPYAFSWAFSVLFHGLAVASAVVFVADLHLAPQPEPFQWDVSVVEKSSHAEAVPPAQSKPAPSPPVRQPVEPQPVAQTVQTVQTVQRVVHQEVRTVTPVVQQVPQPQQAAESSAQNSAQPTESSTSVAEHPVISSAVQATELPVRTSPAPRRDYGWLGELLRQRIEELKRYPQMARVNNWQGKVVLKFVVKEDGTVENLEVVQSSGHAALDEAAMEVLRRASPLSLKHDLGKPKVSFQIPISYTLR